jgi:hypothetical protein
MPSRAPIGRAVHRGRPRCRLTPNHGRRVGVDASVAGGRRGEGTLEERVRAASTNDRPGARDGGELRAAALALRDDGPDSFVEGETERDGRRMRRSGGLPAAGILGERICSGRGLRVGGRRASLGLARLMSAERSQGAKRRAGVVLLGLPVAPEALSPPCREPSVAGRRRSAQAEAGTGALTRSASSESRVP